MNLSKQLEDYDSFLVGYMGCTLDEVRTSMYLSQDHKICVLKMLSLWRCKDGQDEVKTVGELLSVLTDVLHRGPYKVLENLIKGKYSPIMFTYFLTTPRIVYYGHLSEINFKIL